jgi:hypothetical protein
MQQHAGLAEHVAAVCVNDSVPLTIPLAIPENASYTVDNDGKLVITITEPTPESIPEGE